jgi:hypothetical protein
MTTGYRHGIRVALICGLLAWGLSVLAVSIARVPIARGDISSPSAFGPDESISATAGPLAPGTTYSGAFTSSQDIDYLYFEVPQPETLRFDVANTLSSCHPYMIEPAPGEPAPYPEPYPSCPMWATLIDGSSQQLGGEGSAAGTGPIEFSSYEDIEWAFTTAGRYYLVLESDYCGGHPSQCQLPTFQLSLGVVAPPSGGSGGGGTAGGGTGGGTTGGGAGGLGGGTGSKAGGPKAGAQGADGPLSPSYESRLAESPAGAGSSHSLIRSLTLARRQRGAHVVVSVVVAQRLQSLDLWVLAPTGPHHRLTTVGHLLRHHPIAGRERIVIPVEAAGWLTQRRYTPVILRVRARGFHNAIQLFQRRLLLRG